MDKGSQTSTVDNTESSNDISLNVGLDPVMYTATNLALSFKKGKRVIINAVGDAIPSAVAIANIITEDILKDNACVDVITVDSDSPPGIGRMTSTIRIILKRD